MTTLARPRGRALRSSGSLRALTDFPARGITSFLFVRPFSARPGSGGKGGGNQAYGNDQSEGLGSPHGDGMIRPRQAA